MVLLPGERVFPSPFSKINIENGSLKNVHASFTKHIYKVLVLSNDFSQTFARLALVFWLEI